MRPFNNLNLDHSLRQEQRLILTPLMKQNLEILLANRTDIISILEREEGENPMVDELILSKENEPEKKPEKTEKETEKSEEDEFEKLDREELSHNSEDEMVEDTHHYNHEHTEERSLESELFDQLNYSGMEGGNYTAAYSVIDNLDDKGMLETTPEKIAEATGIDIKTVEEAREAVKFFEPEGCGSLSIREYMLFQLKRKKMQETLAYKIVEGYFEQFEKQQLDRIEKALKVNEADLMRAVEEIKALNVHPAQNFDPGRKTEYVEPDMTVTEDGKGGYDIKVIEDWPEVKYNKTYLDMLEKMETEGKTGSKEYESLKAYKERIIAIEKGIKERRETIKKVLMEIIKTQKEYLDKKGEVPLKPLVQKSIAAIVGRDESTISRVVSTKYVQLPFGVFSLKHFFTQNDEQKEAVRKIVEAEDKAKPLTDMEIEQKMGEKGLKISRRTVTKYREQLGIPAANRRKK